MVFGVLLCVEVDWLYVFVFDVGWIVVCEFKEYLWYSDCYYVLFVEDVDGICIEFMYNFLCESI